MVPAMTMYYEPPSLNLLGTVAELTASSSKMGIIHDSLHPNNTPLHYSCESGSSTTCSSNS